MEIPQIIDDKYVEEEIKKAEEGFLHGFGNGNASTEFIHEGLCGCDLSNIDMSGLSLENFRRLTYDSTTIFSPEQIERFHPFDILEEGKRFANMEKTETNETNGSGTAIALIDKFSNIPETQFEGRKISVYKVTKDGIERQQPNEQGMYCIRDNQEHENGFHGNTAVSLAVGKECGVAPNANTILFDMSDDIEYEDAQKAVLDFFIANKENEEFSIPDILSISANTQIDETKLSQLKEMGCAFINSVISRKDFVWGRMNADNTVSLDKFLEDIMANTGNGGIRKIIEGGTKVPVTGRTSSYIDDNGNETYKYNGSLCGNSFAIAQIAGFYLLAKQANKSITFDNFAKIIKEQKEFNLSEILDSIKNLKVKETTEQEERVYGNGRIKDVQILTHNNIGEQVFTGENGITGEENYMTSGIIEGDLAKAKEQTREN